MCCSINKTIIGFFLLTGSLYASELHLNGGCLELDGALSADQITVVNGASLQGTGTLTGDARVAGMLSPGSTATETATLTFLGPLTFLPGSCFECYAATHTDLDKLVVSGTVTGTCDVAMTRAVGAVPLDQVILDADSADYNAFTLGGPVPADWRLASAGSGDLKVTDTVGDTDGDGLPDFWENTYFHGRTTAHPDSDTDHDGMKNAEEEIAGTDPTNKLSRLLITRIEKVNPSTILVAWPSVSNRVYAVHRETSLSNGIPSVARSNLLAHPPENTITFPEDKQLEFYRIRVHKQ